MTDIIWNPETPLERVKGESRKSNQALRDYAMMGSGRSLRKLAERYKQYANEPPTRFNNTLATWSLKNHWVARVEAWTVIEHKREQTEWEKRRREIRQVDWKHAERLRELADKIIEASPAFIKRRVKLERGEIVNGVRVDRQIITVALDGHLLTKLEKVSSDLGRLAAESQLPVQRHDLQGNLLDADSIIAALLKARKDQAEENESK
ncbi:MAG: hypothetical protein KAT00_01350 [Planctomycetes bacterium]|nr:hypothetical protein [Planctomycetota bacterium]